MAFTYPSNPVTLDALNGVSTAGALTNQALVYDGTNWVPAGPLGSLLEPQSVKAGTRQYTIPRVGIHHDSYKPIAAEGRALPLCFDVPTSIWAFHVPYYFNPNRNGTNFYGQSVSNPGWQVRVYVYATDPVTGLPTTKLFASDTATVPALDNGGQASEGVYVEVNPNYQLAANTPVWCAVVWQPVFDAAFPTGWNPNTKYKYTGGAWTADETGAYIGGPFQLEATTSLSPLSDIPLVPWVQDVFGLPFGRNSLWYPVTLWDFDGAGAQVATNISTWAGHTTWPSLTREWIPGSGNNVTFSHAPIGSSNVFYVETSTQAFDV
jgi:hypothetical protein